MTHMLMTLASGKVAVCLEVRFSILSKLVRMIITNGRVFREDTISDPFPSLRWQ